MSDTQNKMPEFTAEEIAKWSVGWSSETLQDKIDAVAHELQVCDDVMVQSREAIEMAEMHIDDAEQKRLEASREYVWLLLQRQAQINAELEKFSWGPF